MIRKDEEAEKHLVALKVCLEFTRVPCDIRDREREMVRGENILEAVSHLNECYGCLALSNQDPTHHETFPYRRSSRKANARLVMVWTWS